MIDPIIYIISAIATETVKDVSKHLGKKGKEIYDNLQEPIVQLGINDYFNPREIQQKLEAKPEVKEEIERNIAVNQEAFDRFLPILRKKFKSYSQTNKNNANLNVSKINRSTITNNIHQSNEQASINYILIIVAIVAIVAIVSIFIFAFKQKSEKLNNQPANTNLTDNSQTKVTISDTNILANVSSVNKLIESDITNTSTKVGIKSTTNKPVTNLAKPESRRKSEPVSNPTPRNF